ncbi:MAG: hypothetical protein LBM61_00465 [Prevotellaceae bacterium]|jgi:hypothetical protein|nr:hypothetical protein [Prevotellaceae bacterium]
MTHYTRIVGLCVLALTATATTFAQNMTSPYTRFGYGDLSNQTIANSRGMGGIAYGMRDRLHINPINPASYTAVDSLTMLFDAGLSLQNTNYIDGITKLNVGNASFDYVAMQFRLRRGIGMTLGLLPYTNVGYSISQYETNTTNPSASNTRSFTGSGGLHQAVIGIGVEPLKNLSVGINASYLWGSLSHSRSVVLSGSGSYMYTDVRYTSIRDVKLDFGAQYSHAVGQRGLLTVGATFAPKQGLDNTGTFQTQTGPDSQNMVTTSKDTVATYELPMSIGVGATYTYDNRLTVGMDLTFQQWGDVTFMNEPNAFYNRTKIAVGAEYLPSLFPRSFLAATKYQIGAFYELPYYKVSYEGEGTFRAAKIYGLTAGFSLPTPQLPGRNTGYSRINVAFQYARTQGNRSRMMNENVFRVSIGITFNERWFFKRQI